MFPVINLQNANIDHETGYHYGVVQFNSLDHDYSQEIFNKAEEHYFNNLPEDQQGDDFDCHEIEGDFSIEVEGGKLEGSLFLFGGAYTLLISNSPVITHKPQCSHCFPNAGNLDEQDDLENGVACYTVPDNFWYNAD